MSFAVTVGEKAVPVDVVSPGLGNDLEGVIRSKVEAKKNGDVSCVNWLAPNEKFHTDRVHIMDVWPCYLSLQTPQ